MTVEVKCTESDRLQKLEDNQNFVEQRIETMENRLIEKIFENKLVLLHPQTYVKLRFQLY